MKLAPVFLMLLFLCLPSVHYGRQGTTVQLFPDKIYFRTATGSFNRSYYFLLRDGKVYVKKIDPTRDPKGWVRIGDNGKNGELKFDQIEQINVDGSQLELVYKNKIFTCNKGLDDYKKWSWDGGWGFPFNHGPGIWLPKEYRAWSVSFSDPKENKYQTDENGNKFYTFVGSLYLLTDRGTLIRLADPWTPADWAYRIGTPLRARFIAVNMSVSASLVFLIGPYGDMYTRHIDFDVIGANPTLRYTYESIPKYDGIFNREHPRKLPIADWVKQPKINGMITGKITVYSTGEGEKARALRVEGIDRTGSTGYFEKALTDTKWYFVRTKGTVDRDQILSNRTEDVSEKELGPSMDNDYTGIFSGHHAVLEDYNLFCSPAGLKIEIKQGSWKRFVLHTVFDFRIFIQKDTGNEPSTQYLKGVVEIPESVAEDRDPDVQKFLKEYLGFTKSSGISRFIPINAVASINDVHLKKSGILSIFSKFKIDFKRSVKTAD